MIYEFLYFFIYLLKLTTPMLKTTKKVEEYLNSNISSWNYQKLEKVELSEEINPLFIRYDKKVIDQERELLNKN